MTTLGSLVQLWLLDHTLVETKGDHNHPPTGSLAEQTCCCSGKGKGSGSLAYLLSPTVFRTYRRNNIIEYYTYSPWESVMIPCTCTKYSIVVASIHDEASPLYKVRTVLVRSGPNFIRWTLLPLSLTSLCYKPSLAGFALILIVTFCTDHAGAALQYDEPKSRQIMTFRPYALTAPRLEGRTHSPKTKG